MDHLKKLELEIAAKKACVMDLRIAKELHKQRGESEVVAVCEWRIKKALYVITRLETQLHDNQQFGHVLQNLGNRG